MSTSRAPAVPKALVERPSNVAEVALRAPGLLLGVALGGFFDGILLHQILQWHHLLSDADWARGGGLALQLLADGAFHGLMYVLALVALAWLWARRRAFGGPAAGAFLVAWLLIGFGAWHVADALLSHWLLGIHRVRSDVGNPLIWDLGWLAVFGVAPMLLGMRRLTDGDSPPANPKAGPLIGWAAALLTVTTAALSLSVPEPGDSRLVVFRPGMTAAQIFAALDGMDARVIRVDALARVWAISLPPGTSAAALYRTGALMVSGSGVAGCVDRLQAVPGSSIPFATTATAPL